MIYSQMEKYNDTIAATILSVTIINVIGEENSCSLPTKI